MGKKPDKTKNVKPKETEEDKLLKQLKKPLKKLVKLHGPGKAQEMVQNLITSIETSLEIKAAKEKIEKEAKAAKKAIDKEAKEALVALSQTKAVAPAPETAHPEEPHPTPVAASPEKKETPPADSSAYASETPSSETSSVRPARVRGTKANASATPTTQNQG